MDAAVNFRDPEKIAVFVLESVAYGAHHAINVAQIKVNLFARRDFLPPMGEFSCLERTGQPGQTRRTGRKNYSASVKERGRSPGCPGCLGSPGILPRPARYPPPASRSGWLSPAGGRPPTSEGNLHGSQVLQPPVRGHGLPDGKRLPLGIPFGNFSMVCPYQSKINHRLCFSFFGVKFF